MTNIEKSTPTENASFPLLKIIATIFAIISIRMFLDKMAYQNTGEYFLPQERAIHASLYYFSIFLSFSILVFAFSKSSFRNILPFMTKIMLFVLLVPVVDLIYMLGKKTTPPIYLVINSNEFLITFFKIMNPFSGQGITFGQHVGAYAIFACLSFFVYKKTKSFTRAILTALVGYAVLFFDAILPSIINVFNNNPVAGKSALDSYYSILQNSWLTATVKSTATYIDTLFLRPDMMINTYHELILARVFWIMVTIEIFFIFFASSKRIWNSVKSDLRMERIVYWLLIVFIGIAINQKMFGSISLLNPANFITIIFFCMLIILNVWLAVLINDSEDIEIDIISNPTRPLAKKEVSEQEWHLMQMILLILVVAGLLALNNATAYMLAFAQATYYLYSAKPLRLKKHFIFSSTLIGFATIFVAMAGFFLVSPDQSFFIFPVKAMIILGISYALLSNLKDIKDFHGDSHEKMQTIPVTFGLENSKRIIAGLYATVLISIPLILKISTMIFPAICISIFLFHLFTKKKYQEKYIFLVFFLYVLALFFAAV